MKYKLKRWLYRSGHPDRVVGVLNAMFRWAVLAGVGGRRLCTLEVRGRRSGRLTSFPVVVADYDGGRYVVAMLGESANWVANLRAAGGNAVLRHGDREAVRLEEVASSQRAPILRRYLQVAPGARAHLPVDRRAPVREFEAIASDYPVFRVRTDSPDFAAEA